MNRKTIKRINGGIAIYYAIGFFIAACGGIVGIGISLFELVVDPVNFQWWLLLMMIVIAAVMGLIGYILLRVGYEQIEE